MKRTRRSLLATGAGALATGALAGCLGEPEAAGGGDDEPNGYAAFFALWDWCEQIAGDAMSFATPVDVGEMGHGWEPPADLPADVAASDVFVYLDTPEFAWAQDLAADLAGDDADVHLVDGMDGLESYLLPAGASGLPEPDPYDDDPEAVEVATFDVYDARTEAEVAYWHDDHWHGGLPDVPEGETATVVGVFTDGDDRVLPLGEDEPFEFDARVVDGAPDDVVEIETDGNEVTFEGLEEGRTQVVFELRTEDETPFDTENDVVSVAVVDDPDTDDEAPDFYDPHVWVDPVIAGEIVETIADGLADVDPDGAETYAENAAAYRERLGDVDARLETIAESATRDVAVFAGHDSFGYLERRYDFEIHTPVGVAPDAAETEGDVAEMIEIVEEHDVDTILYDPFEADDPDEDVPQMVELLLENTAADDYAPLSPLEGTTPAWNEAGWGWIEQMESVNLPSLERALGAE